MKLSLDVYNLRIYNTGYFELQLEDKNNNVQIDLTFGTKEARDKFLDSAQEIER